MTGLQHSDPPSGERTNFIRQIIEADLAAGKNGGRLHLRFPPEPNGYLHVGHAKAICINFGLAERYAGGKCNLRFDDTNPSAEDVEYVDAIREDVRWLGFEWHEREYFASEYFEALYGMALSLVDRGLAYVCDLDAESTREYRGTITSPGRNSPWRERTPSENRDLFERMRAGEFPDGARTLRAKIDMAAPNLNMRDPVLYRILRAHHHRTGDAWCIYPMYDFAHGQSDALEGITHSLCSLEFENHRPLYEWFLDHLDLPARPRQIEFARLNLTHTLTSKRKLRQLVEEGHVSGWDDPRMPTLRGLRRRGYTPEAIRAFVEEIGVAKFNSTVGMVKLENALRDDLNVRAPRRLAVLEPLRLVIENYPQDEEENFAAVNNPEDAAAGTRQVPFGRELWIERDDFRLEAPRKYFRLQPGAEVRLRYACYVTCTGYEQDPRTGAVTLVRCRFDPQSRGGSTPDGRKVKGTIHWLSAAHAEPATVRLYDHLFATEDPEEERVGGSFLDNLNPRSLVAIEDAFVEPSMRGAGVGERFQLERHGYFCVDPDSTPERLVLNRSVALRDSWAKIESRGDA